MTADRTVRGRLEEGCSVTLGTTLTALPRITSCTRLDEVYSRHDSVSREDRETAHIRCIRSKTCLVEQIVSSRLCLSPSTRDHVPDYHRSKLHSPTF